MHGNTSKRGIINIVNSATAKKGYWGMKLYIAGRCNENDSLKTNCGLTS